MSKGPSKEELEFSQLRAEHRKRFNKGYGVTIGIDDDKPLSYHIEILKEALRTGVPAKTPDLSYAIEHGIVL